MINLRYCAVAAALNSFALNGFTRRGYRHLANVRNRFADRGSTINDKYFHMTPGILATIERYGALVDGGQVLEIGTGWTHWDALMLRNQYATHSTLYDIWDNRSFEKFRSYVAQLADPQVRTRLGLDPKRGRALMERAAQARDFPEAYQILDFAYVQDASGKLSSLPEAAFDFLISRDVGEHIYEWDAPEIIAQSFAVLRPGGWAFHQIVLTDHIKIYVRDAHPKEYLRFDRAWHKRWISSNIQYTNLLQVSDWVAIFKQAGFEVMNIDRVGTCDLTRINIHPCWRHYGEQDLACTVVQFLLRKP